MSRRPEPHHVTPAPRAVPVEVLADRLDAAARAIGLEPDEFAALLREVLPELADRRGAGPTAARPGTHAKVTALAHRAAHGLPLFDRGDARGGAAAGPPEFLLVYRLEAADAEAARAEARRVLGRGRGREARRGGAAYGLPTRASVERA